MFLFRDLVKFLSNRNFLRVFKPLKLPCSIWTILFLSKLSECILTTAINRFLVRFFMELLPRCSSYQSGPLLQAPGSISDILFPHMATYVQVGNGWKTSLVMTLSWLYLNPRKPIFTSPLNASESIVDILLLSKINLTHRSKCMKTFPGTCLIELNSRERNLRDPKPSNIPGRSVEILFLNKCKAKYWEGEMYTFLESPALVLW